MIPIKVSGIQSLTDARYCAGMNVAYLSISFGEDGSCKLNPTEFKAIEAWIEGVEWWGEFPGKDAEILKELVDNYGIRTWITDCESGLSDIRQIGYSKPAADGWELGLDGDKAGQISKWTTEVSGLLILQNPENAEEILELHRQFPKLVFNLYSGEEERPGWMDLSGLQDVLEALDEAQ